MFPKDEDILMFVYWWENKLKPFFQFGHVNCQFKLKIRSEIINGLSSNSICIMFNKNFMEPQLLSGVRINVTVKVIVISWLILSWY